MVRAVEHETPAVRVGGEGTAGVDLGSVGERERIEILDVLRGIAVLGIFLMNIPTMASPEAARFADGWSRADFATFSFVYVVATGTQRGLLELVFGAGVMILTARAMTPNGPVAVADLFYRRNLWLFAFGMVDVFAVLWVGDILHVYAVAALLLFPFRRLGARWLLATGLLFAAYSAATQVPGYLQARRAAMALAVAHDHQAAREALTATDRRALAGERDYRALFRPDRVAVAAEARARGTTPLSYARSIWSRWAAWETLPTLSCKVAEAFCTMLIGMALWRWRVIQGDRSRRFYAGLAIAAYGFGLSIRLVDLPAIITLQPGPRLSLLLEEAARLAVTIGHLALVNLLFGTAAGRRLLAPLKAAGRTAFSLYFLTSLIGMWLLFAPWGPGLWGRLTWAWMAGIVIGVDVLLLALANLWLRFFANGPLEWVWRSLSYARRQPFRTRREAPPAALPV